MSAHGTAFIEVPNADNPVALDISVHKEPHVLHFSRKSLEHLLARTGFEILKFDAVSYGYRKNTLSQVLRTLKFLLFRIDVYHNAPVSEADAYRVLVRSI